MDINEVLTRGVTNVIPAKSKLEELLKSKKKLNVYFGVDPTATHIHIGNAVGLRKLQQFVEMGHNVSFLIGDFTALIGDTSDKESERPILTHEQIQENFKNYKEQASKILDFSKVKVVFNSEWLKKLSIEDTIKLSQHFSFGEIASRELIAKRLKDGNHVGLHEALYPVMQGYDSWYMDTDIQIGGADQTFNMQAGRILQKDLRNKESFVLVTGYLEGTDGRKMSKSWGNAIWLDDTADDMYGKVMSLHDNLIVTYLTLATNLSEKEIKEKEKRMNNEPMQVKKELAFQIVKELHSTSDAMSARGNFDLTFQEKKPEYSEIVANKKNIVDTLENILGSKSEVKRMIKAGGVDVNGEKVQENIELKPGDKINLGKRRFLKVL
jgi:tyrosyl-tRNA synthetase